jgi:transposase
MPARIRNTGVRRALSAVTSRSDLFGVGGRQLVAKAPLDAAYRLRVNALCRLIDAVDFEIRAVAGPLRVALVADPGFRAVQTVPGVGPVLAAVFVAEIGDAHRFTSAAHLAATRLQRPRR